MAIEIAGSQAALARFEIKSLQVGVTCAHFSYQVELEDWVVVSKSLSSFSLNSFGVR
ncbi:MAG: hypothetical protein LBS40_05230 [Burkholderiales bacterium]|nr:hypothetical protein [Burkholderiales bacterium]